MSEDPKRLEIALPLPGKENVAVLMPKDITVAEWEMVETMVRGYIELRAPRRRRLWGLG